MSRSFSQLRRHAALLAAASFAGAILLTGSNAFAQQEEAEEPQEATSTFHHRALWMKNPASETVLSWTTREEGHNHRIYYDTESRGGDISEYAYEIPTFADGPITMKDADWEWVEPAFYHHAHLDGLEAGTDYYVVFASDDATSDEFYFRTAPGEDVEFAILFGGDSRIAGSDPYEHTDRQKMNLRMRQLFEDHDNIIALAHGGDYCMLADWRYIEPWLDDHELTTASDGRLLPIIPARGNHDRGVGFEEKFTWPDFDRNYYYETQLSPAVSLITLNTETSLGGDQRDWLGETLAEVRPDRRWVLSQYHRPAFSSVRSTQDGAGRRNNWVPLFEQYNIDLGLESHDHALKRTVPIRSSAPDMENGIIYIGDGGLGVPQRNPDTSRWWLQEPGFAKSVHHVHILNFGHDEMHVRAYAMEEGEDEILDDFTVPARYGIAAGQ